MNVPETPAFPLDNPKSEVGKKWRKLHTEATRRHTSYAAALQASTDAAQAVRDAEATLAAEQYRAAQEGKPSPIAADLAEKVESARKAAHPAAHEPYIRETAHLAHAALAAYDHHRVHNAQALLDELRPVEVEAVASYLDANVKAEELRGQADALVEPSRERLQRARSGARVIGAERLADGDLPHDAPLEHVAIPNADTFAELTPVAQRDASWSFAKTHGRPTQYEVRF